MPYSIYISEEMPTGGARATARIAPSATVITEPGPTQSIGADVSKARSSVDEVSLSDLLKGSKREEGKGPFDPVDDSARQKGGGLF